VTSSIAEIARTRGLPQLAAAVADYEKRGWVGAPRAVTAPSSVEKPADLLSAIARNGLRPELLRALADQLEDRPLERGLLAWDVMNSCVFEEHDGVEPWRDWATSIASQLPPNGRRGFPAAFISAREVVDTIAVPPREKDDDDRLIEGMMAHELAAYSLFKKRSPDQLDFLVEEKLLATTLQVARLFSLARLPTLASFYQEYFRCELAPSQGDEDVCETLLDCGSPDFVPANQTRAAELATYVELRQTAVAGKELQAKALLATIAQETNLSELRGHLGLALLRADLDVMFGGHAEQLPTVHDIAKKNPLWRFARRVQSRLAARQFPKGAEVPESMFDQFVGTFGNDATFWYSMLLEAAQKDKTWLRAVIGRLTSELLTNPHDVEAWRGLALFLDDTQTPTREELDARIGQQSLLG
jgi:hypothetical protein